MEATSIMNIIPITSVCLRKEICSSILSRSNVLFNYSYILRVVLVIIMEFHWFIGRIL